MIRQPTSPEDAYRWYAAAIAGARTLEPPPIDENTPQPGWYKHRFDRRGVFVPARIWIIQHVLDGELVQDEQLACEIGGDRFDPFSFDSLFGLPLWVKLAENPITKAEYDHLMRVRDWAKSSRPDQPEAQPMKPIDFFTTAPPVWGKPKRNIAK